MVFVPLQERYAAERVREGEGHPIGCCVIGKQDKETASEPTFDVASNSVVTFNSVDFKRYYPEDLAQESEQFE